MDPAPSLPLTLSPDRTFGRLPFEPWHECIRFAAMQSVGGPLPFFAVSPSWEESIIASRQLWTTIFFDGGEDEEARIHTFSHLSQDLPLYLVYLYSRDWRTMARFINNHRLRIQSIEDDPKHGYKAAGDLSAILGTISASLPALRYLDSNSKHISKLFLSNCVNLRVLKCPRIRIADEACLGPHVESIGFYDVAPSEIAKLKHRTNIGELELDLYQKDNDGLWDETPTEVFETQMANLFTNIGQSLINLTLTISFHSYSAFILHVSSIPGLHTLSLDLYITENQKDLPHLLPPPIRHPDIQNVRVLSVWCAGSENDTAVEGLMQSLTAEHPLRELYIFNFDISEFDCSVGCAESYLGPLIQSAVSAYMIHVSTGDIHQISPRLKRQLMPRLQFLELSPSELYDYISAPNLRQLKLISKNNVSLEIDAAKDLQKLILPASAMDYVGISDQSSWNCKSIEFMWDTSPEDITPLSRLGFVQLSGGYHNGTAGNVFLLKMLENPEACPRLHTIAILDYPLWELLFEVLRRRNSSGVQRITQIYLPGLPVLQLLWRLVRLLSGETSIFTYRDVDEVIEKRIECPEILSCLRCTQAGYVCCVNRSPSVRYREVDPSDSQSLLYLDDGNDGDENGDSHRYPEVDPSDLRNLLDLDYPRDKEFIAEHNLLDRWRNHQLLSEDIYMQADRGKTSECDAYYRDCTAVITQHTLDGMSIPPWISTSEIWDANYGGLKEKE